MQKLDIEAVIEVAPGSDLDTIRTEFAAAVTAYLRGLSFQRGAEITYNMITAKLMHVAGVTDFFRFTVNGGESNIIMDDYGTAELGELQVTVNSRRS